MVAPRALRWSAGEEDDGYALDVEVFRSELKIMFHAA